MPLAILRIAHDCQILNVSEAQIYYQRVLLGFSRACTNFLSHQHGYLKSRDARLL